MITLWFILQRLTSYHFLHLHLHISALYGCVRPSGRDHHDHIIIIFLLQLTSTTLSFPTAHTSPLRLSFFLLLLSSLPWEDELSSNQDPKSSNSLLQLEQSQPGPAGQSAQHEGTNRYRIFLCRPPPLPSSGSWSWSWGWGSRSRDWRRLEQIWSQQ